MNWSGSTVSLIYLVKEFSKNGYEVIVLTPKDEKLKDRLEKCGAKTIRFVSNFFKNLTLDLHFSDKINIFNLKDLNKILKNLIKFIYGLYFVKKIIKQVNPGILYSNEYVTIYASIAAKASGIAAVTHIRSIFLTGIFGIRRYLLNKAILKYNDLIFPISKIESEQLRTDKKRYLSKIKVVSEFLDKDDFDNSPNISKFKKNYNIPSDKFVVLMLGGVDPIKGSKDFIQAGIKCIKESKRFFFLIAGRIPDVNSKKEDIDYYKECVSIITESSLGKGNLMILGSVEKPRELLECASVLVSPFVMSHFSRPIIEAWALKKAVIATRTRHTEQLITHKRNGLLTEVADSESLANSVMLLESDNELLNYLGDNGYQTVMNNLFSLNGSKEIVSECDFLLEKNILKNNA